MNSTTELTNTMIPSTETSFVPSTTEQAPTPNMLRLTEVPINDENTALNVMIGFLDTAQKRGTFSMDESAKIWECIKCFIKNPESVAP